MKMIVNVNVNIYINKYININANVKMGIKIIIITNITVENSIKITLKKDHENQCTYING